MDRFQSYCYDQKIINAITKLIDEGYTSFESLEDIHQERLATMCLKYLGTDGYNCIIEPENFSQTIHHLIRYMETGQKEYALDLAETMNKNAIEYFSDDLNRLFEEILYSMDTREKLDAGFYPVKDKINGEVRWIYRGA